MTRAIFTAQKGGTLREGDSEMKKLTVNSFVVIKLRSNHTRNREITVADLKKLPTGQELVMGVEGKTLQEAITGRRFRNGDEFDTLTIVGRSLNGIHFVAKRYLGDSSSLVRTNVREYYLEL